MRRFEESELKRWWRHLAPTELLVVTAIFLVGYAAGSCSMWVLR